MKYLKLKALNIMYILYLMGRKEPLFTALTGMRKSSVYADTRRRKVVKPNRTRRLIKKMIVENKEKNSEDIQVSALTEITNIGIISNLTGGITQGDGSGERLRDTLNLRYIHLRQMHNGKTAGGATIYYKVRSLIIQWKPDNAVDAPTLAAIFQNGSTGGYLSPLTEEPDERSKFTVIDDRTLVYSSLNSGSGKALKFVRFYKSLKGKKVKFAAGGVTGRGHIYQILFASNATGDDASTYQSHIRIGYTD